MKEKRYGTLKGLTVPVMVYESASEADAAAGKEHATVDSANDNFHYRGGPAAKTREFICELLEQETGIERKTKPLLGKDGKQKLDPKDQTPMDDWDESEGEYAGRVCAEKNWEDLSQFQSQVDSWAKTANNGEGHLAVNAKEAERKPSLPKKLGAKYKIAAAKVLTIGNIHQVNTNVLSKINKHFAASDDMAKVFTGTYPDGDKAVSFSVSDKDAESLGWLIKEYQDWKANQELASIGI